MTLDEAIIHAREVSEENREKALSSFFPPYADECERCAEEHEKIAEWLQELKEYREVKIIHCKDCKHWGTGIEGETENIKCCEYGKYMVGKHGFCCYAEKECAE